MKQRGYLPTKRGFERHRSAVGIAGMREHIRHLKAMIEGATARQGLDSCLHMSLRHSGS
jgi:hypothetical protein